MLKAGAQWELDFFFGRGGGLAIDIMFPMSCRFSKNFRQCSIML